MNAFIPIALLAVKKIAESMNEFSGGEIESFMVKDNTITLDIAFNGWYQREKIIDCLYSNIIKTKNGSIRMDTSSIELVKVVGQKFIVKKLGTIIINWKNKEKEETIPKEMQNLLSGVSFEEYKSF